MQISLSTRNRLSFKKMFSFHGSDIFVHTGLLPHQLSALTKSSHNGTHILLQDIGNWKEFCERSINPVHLVRCNFDKQEFEWIHSTGNIAGLQDLASSEQHTLTEDEFITECCNQSSERFNQPVIDNFR